jgi:hypothetical protein
MVDDAVKIMSAARAWDEAIEATPTAIHINEN